MSTMISEVYDAFVEAGASQDKARRAAEAVADFEKRFTSTDQRVVHLEGEMKQRFSKVDGELTLLKWMIGIQFGGVAALVAKAFFP